MLTQTGFRESHIIIYVARVHGTTYWEEFARLHVALAFAFLAFATAATGCQGGHRE